MHPKKKAEIDALFREFRETFTGKIVILVGPSGCGKSAAVTIYSEAHQLELAVWHNKSLVSDKEFDEEQISVRGVEELSEYLQMECGVPKIKLGSKPRPAPKVLLLRHLPLISSAQDKDRLLKTLETVLSFTLKKLVFLTVSESEFHSLEAGLPSSVHLIHLNEIANTLLDKAIQRMAGLLGLPSSKEQLLEIRVRSKGDIRAAMNSLLFLSTSSSPNTEGKKRKMEKSYEDVTEGKDASLELFHGLGKFLVHKRKEYVGIGADGLPQMMTSELLFQTTTRPPLYFHPETVLASLDCDIGLFVHMLHENMVDFIGEIEDFSAIMDCFSLGDILVRPRFGKVLDNQIGNEEAEELKMMEARLVARGILRFNDHPIGGKIALMKSQMRNYSREATGKLESLRNQVMKADQGLWTTPFDVVLHEELYFSGFRAIANIPDTDM